MVLARLPIRIFTCFKLVCKQWKSIVESLFFRNLFMSVHQNSASCSWSLMHRFEADTEVVGHYQCDTWGLKRPLGYFINSFVRDMNQKQRNPPQVSIEAYSDAGLILIVQKISYIRDKRFLYVANPVSRECVEIFLETLPIGFGTDESNWSWGLVTRTENGVLVGYKVVLFENQWVYTKLICVIYSSETGLWSQTLNLDPYSSPRCYFHPISLSGNLHWLSWNNDNQDVLSVDFYTASTGSDRCRVTPFPDLEKTTKFTRACTPCQGFLHYMNIVDGSKLCLWKLQSEGWELISEISPGFTLTGLLPLMINSVDAKTAYFWSAERERLLYFNLHNGKYVIHEQMKGICNNGQTNTPSPVNDPRTRIYIQRPRFVDYLINEAFLVPFVLPQWLHRIPTKVSAKQSTTTTAKRGKDTSLSQCKRPFTFQEKGKVKAVYKEKPAAKSQQKPNMNQLSSQQRLQKDIPSKNRTHGGKVVTAIRSDVIKLSNPFETLDDLPE